MRIFIRSSLQSSFWSFSWSRASRPSWARWPCPRPSCRTSSATRRGPPDWPGCNMCCMRDGEIALNGPVANGRGQIWPQIVDYIYPILASEVKCDLRNSIPCPWLHDLYLSVSWKLGFERQILPKIENFYDKFMILVFWAWPPLHGQKRVSNTLIVWHI